MSPRPGGTVTIRARGRTMGLYTTVGPSPGQPAR